MLMILLKLYVSAIFSTGAKGYKVLPSPNKNKVTMIIWLLAKAYVKFHMSSIKNALAHNNLILERVMFLGGGMG